MGRHRVAEEERPSEAAVHRATPDRAAAGAPASGTANSGEADDSPAGAAPADDQPADDEPAAQPFAEPAHNGGVGSRDWQDSADRIAAAVGSGALAHATAAKSEQAVRSGQVRSRPGAGTATDEGKGGFAGRAGAAFARLRARYRWLDHLVRAYGRYDEVSAGRLAAAITYFAFLAVFPLLLLAFSVLGFLLDDDAALTAQVTRFLDQNLPGVPIDSVRGSASTALTLGLVGLFLAGLGWVDAVRSSIRAVWRRDETPGNVVVRKLLDAGSLVALGFLLLVSVGVTVLVSAGARWLLDLFGWEQNAVGEFGLGALGFTAGLVVNVVAFVAFLMGLPRLKMPLRRVLRPAVLGAVAVELLKTVGRFYFENTAANPAYAVVAGSVGLLVFLYLFNQALLFCAALTATSTDEEVSDRPSRSERRAAARAAR